MHERIARLRRATATRSSKALKIETWLRWKVLLPRRHLPFFYAHSENAWLDSLSLVGEGWGEGEAGARAYKPSVLAHDGWHGRGLRRPCSMREWRANEHGRHQPRPCHAELLDCLHIQPVHPRRHIHFDRHGQLQCLRHLLADHGGFGGNRNARGLEDQFVMHLQEHL